MQPNWSSISTQQSTTSHVSSENHDRIKPKGKNTVKKLHQSQRKIRKTKNDYILTTQSTTQQYDLAPLDPDQISTISSEHNFIREEEETDQLTTHTSPIFVLTQSGVRETNLVTVQYKQQPQINNPLEVITNTINNTQEPLQNTNHINKQIIQTNDINQNENINNKENISISINTQ